MLYNGYVISLSLNFSLQLWTEFIETFQPFSIYVNSIEAIHVIYVTISDLIDVEVTFREFLLFLYFLLQWLIKKVHKKIFLSSVWQHTLQESPNGDKCSQIVTVKVLFLCKTFNWFIFRFLSTNSFDDTFQVFSNIFEYTCKLGNWVVP